MYFSFIQAEEDLEDADEAIQVEDLKIGEEGAVIHLKIEDMTPMGDQRLLTMKTAGVMGMVLGERLVATRTEGNILIRAYALLNLCPGLKRN